MTIGTFYGVGVGPGDPELLTLKACRVLREVDVVFTSAQERSGRSLALEIASPHLAVGREVVPLPFSHTFEAVEEGSAHRENAARVLEVLRRPASAAFLTLGDPMTYSTFTYLVTALRGLEPAAPIQVVPGITSYSTAAAASLTPLAEGNESLAVVSAAQGTGPLAAALDAVDNVVVMKSYRRAAEVCDLLETRGLGQRTVFAGDCSRPEAFVLRDLGAVRRLPRRYMSLFLVKQDRRP
ncbi:MAG: precorrin-2 C(20)-methyltransferase [Deltaproteobacteria bacterium]|nr:precorrin-2 C(20)-methyltransferase [Deltaproteobacteria bacterium]